MRRLTRRATNRLRALALPAALLVALSCSRGRSRSGDPAAAGEGAGVQPVYPEASGVAPEPLAEALCRALHDLPEERRARCCAAGPGLTLTAGCARMLSTSLRSHAIALRAAEVDACAAAMARSHAGCEWVGPFPPPPPAECEQVIHGTLGAGASCRSSLECAPGLRCRGVGPTASGVCRPPLPDGAACGLAVDPLAAFARQDALDDAHRECAGHCERHRCVPDVPPGGDCAASVQCAPGHHCGDGRCRPGRVALLDEACSGRCEPGARCVSGRCRRPLPAGSACGSDLECAGACLARDGGGRCARDCSRR